MDRIEQGVISRLADNQDRMSENERRIARAVLEAPADVMSVSSQELARRCNVSQSSIIKFCQKMGLSGFPALKIALSAEVARSERVQQIHGDIFSDDSLGAVARKLFDSKVSALSNTMQLNENGRIEAAVSLLEKANRIILFGVGGSALVARDLSSKLTRFGKAVVEGGDTHIQLANVASLTGDDLLMVISYSGNKPEPLAAVRHAVENGIPTIFLGAFPKDMPPPDVVLKCVADENLVRSSSIATRTAQLAITDLLFVLLVQRRDDVAERIQKAQELVARIP
ncbi:MAG TPA: MurR/RpiR family transcriptional regulator [Devosia sp.]|nr:MurR/RpiR family transcriptional regulator [Devosia sp.]